MPKQNVFKMAALVAACVVGVPSYAQKSPTETVASFSPVEGLEVRLYASEPLVANPIAIDIDVYGRMWVTEGTRYRQNVADPPDDKIKVLEDTDGDGVADKVTVFCSNLNAAMGICVAGTKIYVPESPNLYVYEDKNNDLVPDGPRQTLLTGFGGKNSDHGLHGVVFGPDHKLYMSCGDNGFDVTGPDGRRVQYKWGALLRCEADGTQLEIVAVNLRNPYELAVDSFGNIWCGDNDNDGLKSTRICWILEGGNYGWFGRPELIRNPDGSFDPVHHWRADVPGIVPYALITGFGGPAGMQFYEGAALGRRFDGSIIHCDTGPREIRRYQLARLPGVGFTATLENIVTSSDAFFRPVDPCVAPDGSIYVTDWYDGTLEPFNYDATRGRLYRISRSGQPAGRATAPAAFADDEQALAALASPNLATQYLARERLLASGEGAIARLIAALSRETNQVLRARLLWILGRLRGAADDTIRQSLQSDAAAIRATAVRILRRHGDAYLDAILPLVDDPDGEVCKEALLAAGASALPAATEAILKGYARYDGSDRYLLETLAIASRGREETMFREVVDAADAAFSARMVNIVRILRPDDATKYLAERISRPNVTVGAASEIVAALSSIPTIDAGRAILGLLTSDAPVDVKKLALASLARNLNVPWSALKDDADFRPAIERALDDVPLRAAALDLIGVIGLREATPRIAVLLASDAVSVGDKLAALDVTARLGLDEFAYLAAALLKSKDDDLRSAAVRTLVELRDTKTLGRLLSEASGPKKLQDLAADLLMASSDGPVLMLRLLDGRKLDRALADRIIAAAGEHPDINVRLLFDKYVPQERRAKSLGQSFSAAEILALSGNAARGEAVFARSGAASCRKCHRVRGQGTDIGPELSQIGRKYERPALLDAIMNPSGRMAPEYVPYVVETESGKVYAGFLFEQNAQHLLLKTIEGKLVDIPRNEVAELVKQEKSLMPELVLAGITAQDAADLLAFLAGLQEATSYASTFKMLGPFRNRSPEDRLEDFGPEKTAANPDFAADNAGLRAKKIRWTTVMAKPGASGVPEINRTTIATEMSLPTENVIYYLAARLDSAAEQAATLYVGSDDGVQVWVNGEKVHETEQHRTLLAGDEAISVRLNAGKNIILLKLEQTIGPLGLRLSAAARANLKFEAP